MGRGNDEVLCYLHLLIDATILARVPFREKFARSCFEALLQFSLHSQESNIGECVCVCVCVCVCRGGRGNKQCTHQEHQGFVTSCPGPQTQHLSWL